MVWHLMVGVGCAVAGHAVVLTGRRPVAGWVLVLAALTLFAAPAVRAVGLSALADGLWVAAVLTMIPLALWRVVEPRPALMRWADVLSTVVGLAAACATTAGFALVAILLAAVGGVVVLGAGVLLFELTSGDARRQVLWLVLGFIASVPTNLLLSVVIGGTALDVIAAVLALSLPAAVATAVINPRLVDVRAVLAHLTVLVIMVAFVAASYVGTETTILAVTRPPSRWLPTV